MTQDEVLGRDDVSVSSPTVSRLARNACSAYAAAGVLASAALFFVEGLPVNDTTSRGLDALIGSLELASIAAIWLAFFAPLSYRNWISRAHVRASS